MRGDEVFLCVEEMRAVMKRMRDLYVTNRGRYLLMMKDGTRFVPKQKGKYKGLTDKTLFGHVKRHFSIGVYADHRWSSFVCFDVDAGGKEAVDGVLDGIEAFGVPLDMVHVSTSGGKGYHVEVFFDRPVSLCKLKLFYEWVTDFSSLDRKKVEFCPTDRQSIKLPLSIHPATGNICWFVDRDTLEPIEDAGYILTIDQVPSTGFLALFDDKEFSEAVVEKQAGTDQEKNTYDFDFSEGYPDITEEGTRHDLMLAIAVDLRRNGMSEESCRNFLEVWYGYQNQDYIKTERRIVLRDIDGIVKWVYSDSFRLSIRARITKWDVLTVTRQSSRIRRKLYFAVLVCGFCGKRKIGLRPLAKMTEMSVVSACHKMNELIDEGQIEVRRGRRFHNEGTFASESNTYYISRDRAATTDEHYIEVTYDELRDHFDDVFHHAVHELLDDNDRRYMTRKERRDYNQFVDGRKANDRNPDTPGEESLPGGHNDRARRRSRKTGAHEHTA